MNFLSIEDIAERLIGLVNQFNPNIRQTQAASGSGFMPESDVSTAL